MSLFDRYGIKEVADVTFYELDENNPGVPVKPVLYLDTLKVSTIEQTAENTDAKGGKGNTSLLTWDYGKEITLNLEDALFSSRSLEVMYGSKAKEKLGKRLKTQTIQLNNPGELELFKVAASGNYYASVETAIAIGLPCVATDGDDGVVACHYTENGKSYNGTGTITVNGIELDLMSEIDADLLVSAGLLTEGQAADGESAVLPTGLYLFQIAVELDSIELDISANAFPGTYYVTGDTYTRNETTGKDEFFQFIIPKVKVLSENNTITMEADGDPTVFNMTLKVLKSKNAPMMSLVQYNTKIETV